ncbi:MAG: phosphatidylserine decarboxylase [Acidobacteria bacterium]|jgi:phosphatidylserine decarboxylase|nr:phosphatidylserine decarboxylase [Acidobacteriota bacterium]
MIAQEGWPFVLLPAGAGIVLVIFGWPVPGWILVALGAFGMFFFRNPERRCDASEEIACSPADGKIIAVDTAPEELCERGLTKRVSVFMSVLDVHVNRAPLGGTLVEYQYNPGRKVSAFKEKASLENEQNLSVWDTPKGPIALKQIAGVIARRIVFDHREGTGVQRGDRIGLIRYGSRVDVFLPETAEVLVRVGNRVRAGATPLARVGEPGPK